MEKNNASGGHFPHVLLLHGALGAAIQMEPLRMALLPHFEAHALNLPGHGGREIPEAFSFELFAADLLTFLDQHDIQRAAIFGYSMGGYAALWLAKHFPERVGSIYTLATKFGWNESAAARETAMLDPKKMQEKIPGFIKKLAELHAPQDWQEVVQRTAGMMQELGAHHLTDADFRTINQKVMITVGDSDQMVTREESMQVAKQLPDAGCYIWKDTPHPFEKVNTSALAASIIEFLK